MAEPFSKRFRKFLGAARFVRPSLLYGQIGHDRKNMAIMQDLTVTLEKIAKMQDRIIGNVADIFSATLPKSEVHFAFLIFKGAFHALY